MPLKELSISISNIKLMSLISIDLMLLFRNWILRLNFFTNTFQFRVIFDWDFFYTDHFIFIAIHKKNLIVKIKVVLSDQFNFQNYLFCLNSYLFFFSSRHSSMINPRKSKVSKKFILHKFLNLIFSKSFIYPNNLFIKLFNIHVNCLLK